MSLLEVGGFWVVDTPAQVLRFALFAMRFAGDS